MTDTKTPDAPTLSITIIGDTYCVQDSDGSTWTPGEDAEQEIDASADPEATTLRICAEEPMRGAWSC